ncbi:MAG: anaerobic nitric oxide reductase flavorubredoxin [Spirochaetales bacterium]|uniref:Anaerobic nitric oxide reductase flavorubredoxin n=1 Tax=Candidatus Thalassospirochaeta sargassi TaxID=3119039 RepID=A0AAJ1IF52_9SPIO|nr:anaerobic nitric oxide reductase flavorubredoxin [Spirochaetales bacterium]
MKRKLKSNVDWVGKIDWELTHFHGNEYSTHRGSSYNSYLVKEEKVVLIDTVWAPFAKEFVDNLSKEIELSRIDYIVANHSEVDHSGALPELMKQIPDVPIYCTANGEKVLRGHYHKDWNFQIVKTGDTLDIGNGKQLVFIEAPMLHWPDSMFTYLTGDNILFSNDAFGQHYASEYLFNDLVDQDELYSESIKYYANILTPFSPLITKKINEVLSLEVPVDMIATSHGVIWRDDPTQIVKKYLEWANSYQENRITIVYDTMWEGTRKIAEAISKGIQKADPDVDVRLFNSAKRDKNDIITEIFRSKAILLGSPTINKGILSSMASLIEEMKGLRFKAKKGAAFGPYGWSGESVSILNKALEDSGFELVNAGLKTLWEPDDAILQEAERFGKDFAGRIS